MSSRQLGQVAEQAALDFLLTQHLTLVTRNFSCKTGEIDLILIDRDTLVFVEVRLRNNPNFGTSAETIIAEKQHKIIQTAEFFLQKHPVYRNLACRFDVIAIDAKIAWIKNAFTLDS